MSPNCRNVEIQKEKLFFYTERLIRQNKIQNQLEISKKVHSGSVKNLKKRIRKI